MGGVSLGLGAEPRARVFALARGVLLLAGLVSVGFFVRDVGAFALAAIVQRAAPLLVFVVALEVCRVGSDALATLAAYGERARLVPVRVLVRAAFIARAVSAIAPAGRTAAEATKAALLSPFVGGCAATAAAATGQAVTFVSGGIVSVPCAIAAWVLSGRSAVTVALALHAAVLVSAGLGLRAAMRSEALASWVFRSHVAAAAASSVRAHARRSRLVPPWPVAASLLGRALQVAQYALLARAVGATSGLGGALVAQGTNMVSLALGAFVPGQLGVSEGAFAWSAEVLGVTAAQAISIALLAHALEIVFVAVGALVPLVFRAPLVLSARPSEQSLP